MKKNNNSTILIVDDETDLVFNIKCFLESHGYKCLEANDGEEAIVKVKQHKPDLILLDIKMPKMDGFEVKKTIGNDPKTKYIPVVFISGNVDKEHIASAQALGVSDYIKKPYDNQHLLDVIGKYIKS